MQIATSAASIRLLFVDSTVNNYPDLVAGATPDTKVILLNVAEDGVAQITAALAQHTNVKTVHIASHGSPGSLRLGNCCLNSTTLPHYRSQLQQWRRVLSPDAEVLLYGCRVAAGSAGAAFVEQLHAVLGVSIAASSTLTGSAALGGNWDLDAAIGCITSAIALRPQVLVTYASVLVDTYINEDFSDASGATPPPGWTNVVLAGDPAVDKWRFDNPGNRTLPSYLTTPAAIFDSDNISNNDQPENVALVSPVFNASSESQVFLQFNQQYLGLVDSDYGSEAFVEVFNGTQ